MKSCWLNFRNTEHVFKICSKICKKQSQSTRSEILFHQRFKSWRRCNNNNFFEKHFNSFRIICILAQNLFFNSLPIHIILTWIPMRYQIGITNGHLCKLTLRHILCSEIKIDILNLAQILFYIINLHIILTIKHSIS